MKFIKNISPIIICDIGSSRVDETVFLDNLFKNTNSKLIGFEPNIDEFKKLENSSKKKYYNYGIGDGKIHNLNICAAVGLSSFLQPNMEYLELFHKFEEWAKIEKKIPIKTKKLDELDEKFDFIKIDVQGFESEIIKNGTSKIKDSLVIQVETSPIPLYKKEKNFSYICNQLEQLGFNLHMFNKIHSRTFKPLTVQNSIYNGLNHLFQLDCVFIKNLDNLDKLDAESLKKIILILFWSFKSYDLVDLLVRKLDSLSGENNTSEYRKLASSLKINRLY